MLFLVQSTRRVSKSARVLGHCSTSLKTPPSEQEFSSIFTRLESDDPQDDHGQSRMIDMVIINRALLKQSIDIDLKHMKKQSRSMDKEWLKKQPFYSEMDVSNQAQDIPFISFKSSDPSLRESPKRVLKTAGHRLL